MLFFHNIPKNFIIIQIQFSMTSHLRTLNIYIYGANEMKMEGMLFFSSAVKVHERQFTPLFYPRTICGLGLVVFDNYSEGVTHPVILHAY